MEGTGTQQAGNQKNPARNLGEVWEPDHRVGFANWKLSPFSSRTASPTRFTMHHCILAPRQFTSLALAGFLSRDMGSNLYTTLIGRQNTRFTQVQRATSDPRGKNE